MLRISREGLDFFVMISLFFMIKKRRTEDGRYGSEQDPEFLYCGAY